MALTISGLNIGGKILAGKEVNYWITTLINGEGNSVRNLSVDTQGNFFLATRLLNSSSGYDQAYYKLNNRGAIQWQTGLLAGTNNLTALDTGLDSSGNLYVTGRYENAGATVIDMFVAKVSPTGSVLWQKTIGGAALDAGLGLVVDSSSNVYVTGEQYSQSTGANDFVIIKLDSAGTVQWQRRYGSTLGELGWDLSLDNTGNLLLAGVAGSAAAGDDAILMKLSSADGTIIWQRRLSGSQVDGFRSACVDSSNNIYVAGYTASQTAGQNDFLVAKYNSSGTIQWQRRIGGALADTANVIDIDSQDKIYVAGNLISAGPGTVNFGIVKLDSSGTVQWQRAFGTAGNSFMNGFAIDSNDAMCLHMLADPVSNLGNGVIARLPNDGSLTGTYGSYTYQSVSLTVAATTLTDSTNTAGTATTTLTVSNTSFSETTFNKASSTIILG